MNEYTQMFDAHDASRDRRRQNGVDLAEILWGYVQPRTVIDLGCGMGFFLKAMQDHGADIQAVDGDWAKDLETEIDKGLYDYADLNAPYARDQRYDLAASIEVAEHLNPERSEGFVDDLCALSDVVLFSAGVPGQGGAGHINLRWQSAWARMFAARGYQCYDPIRRKMASRPGSYIWFAQNTLLYVKEGTPVSPLLEENRIMPDAASYVVRKFHKRLLGNQSDKVKRLRARLSGKTSES